MFCIAIIEDEPIYSRELISKIRNCFCEDVPDITCFETAEEFFASEWQERAYTGIFIDIELDSNLNGMAAAQLLRNSGYGGMIVFTTNYAEFVYEGYEVEAFRYLRKPVKQEEIQTCISRMEQELRSERLTFSFHRKQYCIPYHEIIYISSYGHYLTVHTKDHNYEWKYLIKDLLPKLPNSFIRCHRSFVVNLSYLRKLDGKRIYLDNGEKIDVAAGYLDGVRKAVSSLV